MDAKAMPLTTTDERNAARWKIIQAVNNAALRHPRTPKPPTLLGMKHIQLAVFRARQRRLVSDATLVLAGYKPCKARR